MIIYCNQKIKQTKKKIIKGEINVKLDILINKNVAV